MSRREYENKFYKISYVNSDNSSNCSDSHSSDVWLTEMIADERWQMADKSKWKVLLLNLTFAIYCLWVDTDIQLVHTRANKRMKIRLQITSELENDYWCHTTVSPTTQSRRCSTEIWLSFLRSQKNSFYQKWQWNYPVSLFLCIMWCKRKSVWQERADI